jgi:LysR family transcriptional regulator, glycine cleavage system transcriptional activator
MQSLAPIESLECFLAACRFMNFAKASRFVHLSPAAFGQRIRQLEEAVDTALFFRTTRRVDLTDAGRRLIPVVESIIQSVSGLASTAQDEALAVERQITIGTRHELGMSWLLPLLPTLEAQHPGLRIHLHFADSQELLQLLDTGEIDAAVCSVRLPTRRLAFEMLHEERYQFVASKKLIEQEGLHRMSRLLQQTLIDSNASLPLARYWLDADPERMRLQFRDVRYLGTIGAIRAFVRRGVGVAVLPRYFVERDIERGRLGVLFPRKPLQTDHFRLLYARKTHKSGLFAELAETMRESPLR